MASFWRNYPRAVLWHVWVVTLLSAVSAIAWLTDLLTGDDRWLYLAAALFAVNVAQVIVSKRAWDASHQESAPGRLARAIHVLEEVKEEGAQLHESIKKDQPRIKSSPGPKASAQHWVDEAATVVGDVRGEPSANQLRRRCASFGTGGEWSGSTCREIIREGSSFIEKILVDLDESKLREGFSAAYERPRETSESE